MKKLLLILFFAYFSTNAQLTSTQIDALVEKTLTTFNVPGIAVGIVKDGRLIHAKGYGKTSLKTGKPVNENTHFGIASNSKAFTAAALGILIDENKLTWDTRVTDVIPEFKMYDPYVTAEFTVRDLLTHRSGLGLGAGDLMFWPDSNNFSKADIIHHLRFLKPVSSFRTKYDYDNLLYIVAGEVIARISGMSWEDFIQTRIFKPLEINTSAPSYFLLKDKTNVIDPHAPVDGQVKVIRRDWSQTANAAGGIYANVVDMSKWLIMLLNGGKYGNNLEKRLLSEKTMKEIWTPQTILKVGNPGIYNTHFSAYGLGWFLSDVKGYLQATHTGGLAGIVTQTTLLPELGLGIMVYTNQQSGAAFSAITNSIKDAYLGIKGQDRIAEYSSKEKAAFQEAESIKMSIQSEMQKVQSNTNFIYSLLGNYSDEWFGEVEIYKKENRYFFKSKKSFQLEGELFFYKANTLVVKWFERSFDADAFLIFRLNENGEPEGFKMKAISPLTDFSFDFQDLDFKAIR